MWDRIVKLIWTAIAILALLVITHDKIAYLIPIGLVAFVAYFAWECYDVRRPREPLPDTWAESVGATMERSSEEEDDEQGEPF